MIEAGAGPTNLESCTLSSSKRFATRYNEKLKKLYQLGYTGGLTTFLVRDRNKTSTAPQSIEIQHKKLLSLINDNVVIYNTGSNVAFYYHKHSLLQYQTDSGGQLRYAGRSSMLMGEILKDIWKNSMDTHEFYKELVSGLPYIYSIGNYKFTLGEFIQKTNWINLPISEIFKTYVIVSLLNYHPNDHLFEGWLKYQLSSRTNEEWVKYLTSLFGELYVNGMEWHSKYYTSQQRHYGYRSEDADLPGVPWEEVRWASLVLSLVVKRGGTHYYGDTPASKEWEKHYPLMLSYHLDKFCGYGGNSEFITPTRSYKNICAQLHMSSSMFKSFMNSSPYKTSSTVIKNWCDFLYDCRRLFNNSELNYSLATTNSIRTIAHKITANEYELISNFISNLTKNKDWYFRHSCYDQIKRLIHFVNGHNNILTPETMCAAITVINQKQLSILYYCDELIREVSSPNSLLRRTAAPTSLKEFTPNYISGWVRREDVLHLVDMLNRSRYSQLNWNTIMEDLQANKKTLSEYLQILHDFYYQVDNTLHQEAVLLEEAETNKQLIEVSTDLEKYIYSDDNLIIRPAHDIVELQIEGQTLHHCVFGFRKKIAQRSSYIFFIRNKSMENTPYYTVELVNDSTKWIRQVHGKGNSQPTPQIVEFLKKWVKKFKFNPNVKETYGLLG